MKGIYVVATTNGKDTFVKLGYSKNIRKSLMKRCKYNPALQIKYTGKVSYKPKDFVESFHKIYEGSSEDGWYADNDGTVLGTILGAIATYNKLFENK